VNFLTFRLSTFDHESRSQKSKVEGRKGSMTGTPKLGKGLGRTPDKPDTRDLHVPQLRHLGINAPLPTEIDLFAGLSLPVYDQGALGSCTANAGVLYRRYLSQKFAKYSAADQDLSRLFLYYQERRLEGDSQIDDGAQMRSAFRALTKTGVCLEEDDPYVAADFASAAWNDASEKLTAAAQYKIGAYHRVPDVDTARSVLASSYPIALGFTVYASFEEIGRDGAMRMPGRGEGVLGGHAVVIRGYDDRRSDFFVQNSWGPEWGDHGCFHMPYAFVEDVQLSQPDMWIGHLGAPWRA
jgi:C1A family cysteine protease